MTDPQHTTSPERDRLDGWKEIAAHFGRGVRTVQRWERELQLPVRRIDTGRGQVTYAFVDELDRWRESAAATKAALDTGANGEAEGNAHTISESTGRTGASSSPIQTSNSGRSARAGAAVAAGVVLLTILSIVVWVWIAGSTNPPLPASAEVANDELVVSDAAGNVLWRQRFDFPLTEDVYSRLQPGKDYASIVVDDLDHDGAAEVLFVAEPWLANGQGLFCFNADGSIRFNHVPARAVRFGGKIYAPPWRGVSVYVSGQAGRPRDIWFVSTHLVEFPTLLEKLDPAGQVTAEYWSNGQIASVRTGEVEGVPLVFVGAINNESKGASLAVLDAQHLSGSAPAMADTYRCAGCPAGGPLAFFVFPRLDVTAAIGSHSHVSNVFVDRLGQILVGVFHDVGDGVPQELRGNATTEYRLDSGFRVIGAELGERLPSVHELFEQRGLLDHPFSGENDSRFLWPVRRWDSSGFVEITRPEAPAGK
ncbi:MAG: hypothetical protein R6V57_17100 [Vicinamibacterales bacterium]